MTDTATRTFSVPDISCDHCVSAITENVSPVDGVERVDVDLGAKTVTVTGGDESSIRHAIDEAGFDIAG